MNPNEAQQKVLEFAILEQQLIQSIPLWCTHAVIIDIDQLRIMQTAITAAISAYEDE